MSSGSSGIKSLSTPREKGGSTTPGNPTVLSRTNSHEDKGESMEKDHKTWLEKHSHAFIQIKNDDDLCLARALVVAKTRADKEARDPLAVAVWNTIRQERAGRSGQNTAQKRLAVKLMWDCGLQDHQGPCGLKELQKFQDFLAPEYQIKVFSAPALNAMVFKGPQEAGRVLYLYHDRDNDAATEDVGHFLVCTKPHVIFNTAYFCDVCNRGVKDKDRHKCINKCNFCRSLKKCDQVVYMHCDDCNGSFSSQACFDNHKRIAEEANNGGKRRRVMSTCQRRRWCKDCHCRLNLNGLTRHRSWCKAQHPQGEKERGGEKEEVE